MCGIVGFVESHPSSAEALRATALAAVGALRRRGPDGEGVWIDSRGQVALGHTRLAIVDLSATGAQPMVSPDGRWVITFNGEIYNHAELVVDLRSRGTVPRGRSDTEVFLLLIQTIGIDRAVRAADGMWAFAAFDTVSRELWLCRDRFGEKPLYTSAIGPALWFASDLAAMRDVPGFDRTVDQATLERFLSTGSIDAPASIYSNARQLRPGELVGYSVQDGTRLAMGDGRRIRYWDAHDEALVASATPPPSSASSREGVLDALRMNVVRRSRADVSVGMLLSGGVDSALAAALWRQHTDGPFTTFTVGFHDEQLDESTRARAIADRLGTTHVSETISDNDVLRIVTDLPRVYSEPLADPSQIATVFVAEMARRHCKVVLTGDGGDELFGGYTRLHQATRVRGLAEALPGVARRPIASAVIGSAALARLVRRPRSASRLERAAAVATARSARDSYAAMMHRGVGRVSAADPSTAPQHLRLQNSLTFAEELLLLDTENFLPSVALTKLDRASMSVGLEARPCFLSADLYVAAWALPQEERVGPRPGKRVLREALASLLPDLIGGPKRGLEVPLVQWLAGPLDEWSNDLLTSGQLSATGVADTTDAKSLVRAWRSGRATARDVWPLLVFQSWAIAQR